MNAIQFLAAQPWVERLGATLLHFWWQGIAIAAVYAAIRRWTARAAGSDARYLLACAALAGMIVAPVVTWIVLSPAAAVSVPAPAHLVPAVPVSSPPMGVTGPALLRGSVPLPLPVVLLPWVVAAWLAGGAGFWLRLAGGSLCAAYLRSRRVRPAPREWQEALDRLKSRIRVGRRVRLLVSALTPTPSVVGWLRPVVLVPAGALAGLPPEQVEALLLHELAHIRRHDYLVNMLQSFVEAWLFYHPAVWWVSGHIRAERELCCDDAVVSVTGDVLTYAHALAELESARPAGLRPAMAATGGVLAHRIGRLLGQARPAPRTVPGPGISAAAVLPAIAVLAVFGQPAARPKFEVASIKPSPDQRLMVVRPRPGRLTANAPVRLLVQIAYTVQPFQIEGGPSWANTERYEIEAKGEGDAGPAQLFLMLQSLLEDRFQLKIHRETREMPVYALVPARSGLKLPPAKSGSCASPDPDAAPAWMGGRIAPPGGGPAPLPRCGGVMVMLESSGARIQGGKVPMSELVRTLSLVLGRPVIDRTGVTEPFDVQLDFLPDAASSALPPPPPDSAVLADSNNPSILTAIQEQLGLRLESTKGPVEVLVIDHVERPSAN